MFRGLNRLSSLTGRLLHCHWAPAKAAAFPALPTPSIIHQLLQSQRHQHRRDLETASGDFGPRKPENQWSKRNAYSTQSASGCGELQVEEKLRYLSVIANHLYLIFLRGLPEMRLPLVGLCVLFCIRAQTTFRALARRSNALDLPI